MVPLLAGGVPLWGVEREARGEQAKKRVRLGEKARPPDPRPPARRPRPSLLLSFRLTISNLTPCSGMALVRKAAPMVDSWLWAMEKR